MAKIKVRVPLLPVVEHALMPHTPPNHQAEGIVLQIEAMTRPGETEPRAYFLTPAQAEQIGIDLQKAAAMSTPGHRH